MTNTSQASMLIATVSFSPFEMPPTREISELRLEDSFGNQRKLLVDRAVNAQIHWPAFFFSEFSRFRHGILLLLNRDSDAVSAWVVDYQNKDVAECVSMHSLSLKSLCKFLGIFSGLDFDASKSCLVFSKSEDSAPAWLAGAKKEFYGGLQKACSKETISYFCECDLMAILFREKGYNGIGDPGSLLAAAANLLDPEEHKIAASFYQVLQRRIGDRGNKVNFSSNARYTLLREIIFLITRKHITIDPFTNRYVISNDSEYDVTGFSTSSLKAKRFISFRSPLGVDFVEVRGPGWLDVTSRIIFENGLYFNLAPGQEWGFSFEDEDAQCVKGLFKKHEKLSSPKPIAFLVDCGGGTNVGHVLWNEASAYVEFVKICCEINWYPADLRIVFPEPVVGPFSNTAAREFFASFIKIAINNVATKNTQSRVASFFKDQCMHPGDINQFAYTNHASFRYPRVSRSLSATIRRYYSNPCPIDMHSKRKRRIYILRHEESLRNACMRCYALLLSITRGMQHEDYATATRSSIEKRKILINLRVHNKFHANIVECLRYSLEKLRYGSDFADQFSIELEFAEEAALVAQQIKQLCQDLFIECNLHIGLNLHDLLLLTSGSFICIAPIGSGAVVPTWICKKPTVLHGDKGHMHQIHMWPYVGRCRTGILVPVENDAISDHSAEFYSNYSIEPPAYLEALTKAIAVNS